MSMSWFGGVQMSRYLPRASRTRHGEGNRYAPHTLPGFAFGVKVRVRRILNFATFKPKIRVSAGWQSWHPREALTLAYLKADAVVELASQSGPEGCNHLGGGQQ